MIAEQNHIIIFPHILNKINANMINRSDIHKEVYEIWIIVQEYYANYIKQIY